MADNVTVDNATLPQYKVSSDDATSGSGQVQRVKLAQSIDGSDSHVLADGNGVLVQGQVSIANSLNVSQAGSFAVTVGTVNVSQAGSFSVTQGTSPWLASIGGSVNVGNTVNISPAGSVAITAGTLNVSQAGSFNINNNPLNVLASQAGSWSIANNPLNVLASQAGSWVVDEGNTPFNVNLASQSLSVVTIDEGVTPLNTNLASQSLSAVKVTSDINTLNVNVASFSNTATRNVNLASQSLSAVSASIVGSVMIYPGPDTWRGTFKSAGGALGSFTQSAGGAGVKNYIDGFTYSWNAMSLTASITFQIKDNTTVIYEEAIAGNTALSGNKTVIFGTPIAGSAASTMTSQFSALSATAVQVVSAWGYQGA